MQTTNFRYGQLTQTSPAFRRFGRSVLTAVVFIGLGLPSSGLMLRKAWSADGDQKETIERLPLDVARGRAKILHDVYESSLEVIHRRYFHGQRATVPARAMEDVFAEIKRRSGIEARWISVTLEPMSINHEPETAFEKMAARELKSGKDVIDLVDDGFYRRAVAIPLRGGCIHCHDRSIGQRFNRPVAGLVISIPIEK